MAYINSNDEKFVEDIVQRHEFSRYYFDSPIIPDDSLSHIQGNNVHLDLQGIQRLCVDLMNPNTELCRLLVKWDPGMGKTIFACYLAHTFIKNFIQEHKTGEVHGHVIIIGFTEDIFKKELIRFPDFGYVTKEEVLEQKRLLNRSHHSDYDLDRYHDYVSKLKKRLTNENFGGFFKFYGYKAFVNRIFNLVDSAQAIDIVSMDEEAFTKALRDGSLQWNMDMLRMFDRSLLICDEIHNAYNSLEKNNWGIAIQMIINKLRKKLKAVYLSATPINNSPSEITDVINILDDTGEKIEKNLLFDKDGRTMKPGAIEIIRQKTRGKVSFVQDTNPLYYATDSYEGETITGIKYLKFIKCPMTRKHQTIYNRDYEGILNQESQYLMDFILPGGIYKTSDIKQNLSDPGFVYSENRIIGTGLERKTLQEYSSKMIKMLDMLDDMLKDPLSGKILIFHPVVHISGVLFVEDVLLSNGYISYDQSPNDNTKCSKCGIIRKKHAGVVIDEKKESDSSINIREATPDDYVKLKNILKEAFDKVDFSTKQFMESTYVIEDDKKQKIYGFIEVELSNGEYYVDADKFIRYIVIKEAQKGKGYGTKLLGHVLEGNNGHVTLHINKKWGVKTKYLLKWFKDRMFNNSGIKHKLNWILQYEKPRIPDFKNHDYTPARIVTVHSNIDKTTIHRYFDAINANNNIWGHKCRILIGSKMIKESYNMYAFQKHIVLRMPSNISTLVQLNGRVRRKNGSMLLPPEHRHITRYILVSTSSGKKKSHEIKKWREKMEDYETIQKIEKILHENAIDASIIWEINKPRTESNQKPALGALSFTPKVPKPKLPGNKSTYDVYFQKAELQNTVILIKKLFITVSDVFTTDQLWDAMQDMKSNTFNISSISREVFNLAVNFLIINPREDEVFARKETKLDHLNIWDLLYQGLDSRIMIENGNVGHIYKINDYLIFVPTEIPTAELSFRKTEVLPAININMHRYIKKFQETSSYDEQKVEIHKKFKDATIGEIAKSVGAFGEEFHNILVEEIIEYIFNIWTSPSMTGKSEYHEFLIKMYQYYNLMGLIIFVGNIKKDLQLQYSPYVNEPLPINTTSVSIVASSNTSQKKKSKDDQKDKLKLSESAYFKTLQMTNDIIASATKSKKKKSTEHKVEIELKSSVKILPIGHFVSITPRLYNPSKSGWFDESNYTQPIQDVKENNIIIGYHEKLTGKLNIKFKIRNPIQNIEKHSDTRMIEKGAMCSTKNKEYLKSIAKKLEIPVDAKHNVGNLCESIEHMLINNEMLARKHKTGIKWFYSFWENRPDNTQIDVGNKHMSSSSSA